MEMSALDDAMYVAQNVDDELVPSMPWPLPTDEEVNAYKTKLLHENAKALTVKFLKSCSLGSYCTKQYKEDTADDESPPDFTESPHCKTYLQYMCLLHSFKPSPEFFDEHRVLGKGGFGIVNASKFRCTGKMYAKKLQGKLRVKSKKGQGLALAEREVMETLAPVSSDFIIKLNFAYQTKDDLVLILEVMTGGDLQFHLKELRKFNPEMTRYYAACCVAGLAHIHQVGYGYRDMKPENLLLSNKGVMKMSDMGLAAPIDKLKGGSGTLGYWAPEVAILRLKERSEGKSRKYNEVVDWWGLGVCMVEFITGTNPFREKGDGSEKVNTAICDEEPDLSTLSADAQEVCKGLLIKDPANRLGSGGVDAIKDMPYFVKDDADFWKKVYKLTLPIPFVPDMSKTNAKGAEDIGFFEPVQGVKWDENEDQKNFEQWTYINEALWKDNVVDFLKEEKKNQVVVSKKGGGCVTM